MSDKKVEVPETKKRGKGVFQWEGKYYLVGLPDEQLLKLPKMTKERLNKIKNTSKVI